ncbi:MAG: EAL domain-containing protein [Oscillospiraceae bacterium]|nr:EAL domain-containing protein [Oscillospiraceae bacterium]
MIYFDICAVLVLCMLLFSAFFRKMTVGLTNRLFITLLFVTLATAVSDIFSVVVPYSKGELTGTLCAGFQYLYLILRNSMSPVYILYLISLTDTWHKLNKSLAFKLFLIIPYSAIIVTLVSNAFTDAVFSFDENGAYTRGPAMPALYVCSFIYLVTGICYIIRYKDLFKTEKLLALCAIFPLTLISLAIQWFFPHMLVEMFAAAISLLLIIVTVQRPEELLDSLTGLSKYVAYGVDMKRNFANGKRVGIILVNISNYSSMHAILGFDNLNAMLKRIADRFVAINKEEKLRAGLYYLDRGRYRFVVTENNWDKLESTAEKINSELKQSIIFNQMSLNLIAHVCIAHCPEEITDFEPLMAFGNELNDMPYSGRVIRTSEIAKENRFRLSNELDAIIDNAIANRTFEVYYQPIYSIGTDNFISAEALLRLHHDKYGFIPPDLFITAAEKSGAIHKIGELVLEKVCSFIASSEFKELGLQYIEINLSVAQCMQADLADKILQIMKRYGVSPDKINLEITETAASYSQNIMMENLEKLTQAGIEFSLDDYGTGYSNIKSVASLPIKIVKLDKTFVDSEDNPRMWIVLKNTIKMLKDMNMHIVVEGIETESLVKKFTELNCEYIQGYYYSRPIPESDFVAFMRKHAGKKVK